MQPDPEVLELAILELKEECGDDSERFRALLPGLVESWRRGEVE
jgi:hypothetical protein